MIATSVPGTGANHSQSPSTSSRSGEKDTMCPPLVAEAVQRVAGRMCGGAAVVDPGVLQRQPAETHQQIGVFDDDVPLGGALEQVVVGADHSRHDDAGRAETVGVPRKGIPAKEFQKAVYLTLGVVEPARAGPPVGAAVDRLVAVGVDDAAKLACEQLGEFVP